MKTAFILMAQYDGMAIIPAEIVVRDFFRHLDLVKFIRKTGDGSIRLPVIRMEASAKSARGVHIQDMADYLDKQREAAQKELAQVTRGVPA